LARIPGIAQLAAAGDHHNGAGHAIGVDLLLQYCPNAGEPVRRDIDSFGLCGRHYLRKGGAREDQGRSDKQKFQRRFHAFLPCLSFCPLVREVAMMFYRLLDDKAGDGRIYPKLTCRRLVRKGRIGQNLTRLQRPLWCNADFGGAD
jgi:hypothetical protein